MGSRELEIHATTVGIGYLLELIFDTVAIEVVDSLNPFLG
jgi:hypothetical protein